MLMEALQLLKFLLKKECLNFTCGWATSEVAMGVSVACHDLGSLSVDNLDGALDNLLMELSVNDGEL